MKSVITARHAGIFILLCLAPGRLHASSGGGLPWEAPLEQIQQSITGPVAGFIALSAVAVAGGMLIFGGELNDFARRLMYVVLVAGILLGASQIVSLFGATGAVVARNEEVATRQARVGDGVPSLTDGGAPGRGPCRHPIGEGRAA
jgi:type IV secretion system protein VirB2